MRQFALLMTCVFAAPSLGLGETVYLNKDNISVAVGPGTSPGTFNNTFDNGQTIVKVIDAPSADAEELHNQTTHNWFTATDAGGGLELVFDLGVAYDISTLHFWNYTSEDFDVDNIDFTFFNLNGQQVGSISVQPELGTSPGITSQDTVLAAPVNVARINAFLTGSNREVDFQNVGFTAEVSVPEPSSLALLALGAAAIIARRRMVRR